VIHKLINSIWIKEELPDQWKEPIVLPMKLLGIISVGFDVTDQLLSRYFALIRYWGGKNGSTMRLCISYS
jgi:hypothetical protein